MNENYWQALRQTGAKKIVVKEGITTIPVHAFEAIEAEEIVLPKSLVEIRWAAFARSSIKKIVIPEGVTTIESKAFYKCKALEEVIFPKTLETINSSAFWGCEKLLKVIIPHVTEIGDKVFDNCTSLKELKVLSGMVKMGSEVCSNCSSLKEVYTCDGIQILAKRSFQNTSIEDISLPDSITSIGDEAFINCEKLKTINLPKNLEYISSKMLADCPKLETINIPETVTDIFDEAFSGCVSLKAITCPSSVEAIWISAFKGCSSLKKVVFLGDTDIKSEIFSKHVLLTELRVSSKMLLKASDKCLLSSLKKLVIDDFVIDTPIEEYGMKESDFAGTDLELFTDTLMSLKEATDTISSFIITMIQYLFLTKEKL